MGVPAARPGLVAAPAAVGAGMPALTTPRVGGGQCLWAETGRTSELVTRKPVSRRVLRIDFMIGSERGESRLPHPRPRNVRARRKAHPTRSSCKLAPHQERTRTGCGRSRSGTRSRTIQLPKAEPRDSPELASGRQPLPTSNDPPPRLRLSRPRRAIFERLGERPGWLLTPQ